VQESNVGNAGGESIDVAKVAPVPGAYSDGIDRAGGHGAPPIRSGSATRNGCDAYCPAPRSKAALVLQNQMPRHRPAMRAWMIH
jgi:hypothetical protein